MSTRRNLMLLTVIAAVLLIAAVAVVVIPHASHEAPTHSAKPAVMSAGPVPGQMITADDGTRCRYLAPYVNGGGPRPGMVFDRQCRAVPEHAGPQNRQQQGTESPHPWPQQAT